MRQTNNGMINDSAYHAGIFFYIKSSWERALDRIPCARLPVGDNIALFVLFAPNQCRLLLNNVFFSFDVVFPLFVFGWKNSLFHFPLSSISGELISARSSVCSDIMLVCVLSFAQSLFEIRKEI